MTVNGLLEQHSDSQSRLKVRLLPPEKSERESSVLIEGDRSALRFLGELLLAIADQPAGYDLPLHPSGAGSVHFQPGSDLGFYVRMTGDDEDGHGAEVRIS